VSNSKCQVGSAWQLLVGRSLEKLVASKGPSKWSEARPGRYHGPFQACALVLRRCAEGSGTGARIAAALAPADDDYIVLEPKHSAFFATPLDLLLRHLRVRRVVITGVATDQCIFLTAVEARMQDYAVAVPED